MVTGSGPVLSLSSQVFSGMANASVSTASVPSDNAITAQKGASGAAESAVVDTVAISEESRLAAEDLEGTSADSEANGQNVRGVLPPEGASVQTTAVAKVAFEYNESGEKVVKYMDRSERLVYQTPSELTLLLRESPAKTDRAVNTTA